MPARKDYTPEFKDQAVRFVFEEIEPDEGTGVARSGWRSRPRCPSGSTAWS